MAKARGANKQPDFLPQCFTVTCGVYPTIAMVKGDALLLAQKLSEHTELTDIHLADEQWEFRRPQPRQGNPRGQIQVKIREDEVTIEHQSPTGGLERFEGLIDNSLHAIESVVRPEALYGSGVELEYHVRIGGDARKVLMEKLRLRGEEEEADKLAVFRRPCHAVGLRLWFPPFRYPGKPSVEGERKVRQEDEDPGEALVEQLSGNGNTGRREAQPAGADWAATLTVETLLDDPSALSVEVHGRWGRPQEWDSKVVGAVQKRVRAVDDFLRQQITEFLEHFRSES